MTPDHARHIIDHDHIGSPTAPWVDWHRDGARRWCTCARSECDWPRCAPLEEDDPSHPSGAAIGYAFVAVVTALVAGPVGFWIGRWW